MKRREFIQSGMTLPVAGLGLAGCFSGASNRYLEGNFAPVLAESTVTSLDVTGIIPNELAGRFVRNGPNPNGNDSRSRYHWFVGRGMVHGVRLDAGRAMWYRNRYVASGSGQTPNTSVIEHAGRTLAIVESGSLPVELDYELTSVNDDMKMGGGFTAHPQLDPDTGDLHAVCYDWATLRDHVRYVVIDRAGALKSEMKIPLPGMSMIHNMSITQRYAVIYDLPVTMSFLALGTGASFPFRWNDDHEARIGLVPRQGDDRNIIWSSVKPNYAYHPMNAYEDPEGRVVIDIIRYDKMFQSDTNGPFGDGLPRLDRWTINPVSRALREEIVDERPQEFPRCHPDLNGKPYRYGYALSVDADYGFPAIYKHDVRKGVATQFSFNSGQHGAEPVFIPRALAQSEDDGYLMTYVYDANRDASDLAIFDAQDLERGPVASVHLPVRVPYGFHGNWILDQSKSGATT